MKTSSFFIGIPCYQATPSLEQTIHAIQATSQVPHHLEVYEAKQSVVKNKNALLQRARMMDAQYVCFCDDDVEPQPGWDRKLISALERLQRRLGVRIGQTTPRLLRPDGRIFSLWVNIDLTPKGETFPIHNIGGTPDWPYYRCYAFVGALAGTCTIFTSEFLNDVGWQFDEQYEKSQAEDIDQSLTCRDLGYRLLYNGYGAVIHRYEKVSPRDWFGNRKKFYEKWSCKPWISMTVSPLPLGIAAASPIAWHRWWAYTAQSVQMIFEHPFLRLVKGIRVLRTQGIRAVVTRIGQSIHEPFP